MSSTLVVLPSADSGRRVHPRMQLREFACRMSGSAARMFLYLVGRANEDGEAWPSASTMGQDLDMARSTVQLTLAELRKMGVFTESPGRGGIVIRQFSRDWMEWLPPVRNSGHLSDLPDDLSEIPDTCPTDRTPPVRNSGHRSVLPLNSNNTTSRATCEGGVPLEPDQEPEPPKKKRGIRRKKEFPPEVHAFVASFREDFNDNVEKDFEWDVASANELGEAQKLLKEGTAQELQSEKEWFMLNGSETPPANGEWGGWKWVIRSVSGWRKKRTKIRNAMKGLRGS